MSRYTNAMLGGLVGGLVVSAAIAVARQSGLGHAAVSDDEEALLDRPSDALRRRDRASAFASAQGNHLLASIGFGQAYAVVRERLPDVPPVLLGAAYGALLHAVTTAGLGHAVGIARGEFRAPEGGAVKRFGAHVVFGMVTAIATDWIERRRG
ncbi:hypothetical protein [Afifella sp. IM 167]|uniref:hypothetical protein n=1 Tax=Afifella sp. IM 167 TaxID=2033586 RepID=UPI001CCCD07C|nr:hypothetical protein [Afifella sp. IM 167]